LEKAIRQTKTVFCTRYGGNHHTYNMSLTFNSRLGKPQVSFISKNSWILDSENIAGIIGDPSGPKKELLFEIIQAAAKCLTK